MKLGFYIWGFGIKEEREITFDEFFEVGRSKGGDVGRVLSKEMIVVVFLFEGMEIWGEDEGGSHF